jgi:hypothetical protein
MQSGPGPFGRALTKPRMWWESAEVRATVTAPEVRKSDTDRYPVSFMADDALSWGPGPDPAFVHATARAEIVMQIRIRAGTAPDRAHRRHIVKLCPPITLAAPG